MGTIRIYDRMKERTVATFNSYQEGIDYMHNNKDACEKGCWIGKNGELSKLREAVKKEYEALAEKSKKNIAENESVLKAASTARRWEQYQNGEITREQAIKYAQNRRERELKRGLERELAKITETEMAIEPQTITIFVSWHRSRTWGMNPSVEVQTDRGTTRGTASGCGYDKESAAIAEALNEQKGIMYLLYKEKDLMPLETNHKIFGYGSGYGTRPYFEGGVGTSCHIRILEKIGYAKIAGTHDKNNSVYVFQRGGTRW